jgi:predicted acylesterase/phospholipase RssA
MFEKKIRNIVFSGASTKIFLFIGFLKYIKEYYSSILDQLTHYCGTSSGALIACGLVLGFSIEEMEELLIKLDFSQFKDINSDGILSFFDNYGLDNCCQFEKLFRIMIKKKTNNENITFHELYLLTSKTLTIVATNLNRKQTTYFSHKNTPYVKVVDAIIASISLPILYYPKKIDNELYLDGGITNNFAINIFKESKEETIGALVMSNNKPQEITNFFDIISSIVFCGVENQSKELIKEYRNILVLDNDIDSTDFSINRESKIMSINDGYEQTYTFFKKNL